MLNHTRTAGLSLVVGPRSTSTPTVIWPVVSILSTTDQRSTSNRRRTSQVRYLPSLLALLIHPLALAVRSRVETAYLGSPMPCTNNSTSRLQPPSHTPPACVSQVSTTLLFSCPCPTSTRLVFLSAVRPPKTAASKMTPGDWVEFIRLLLVTSPMVTLRVPSHRPCFFA